MTEWALDGLVTAEDALEREFGERLRESSSLAFRVAYGVLRHQTTKGVPSFRNFTSNFSILLKDGQTAQYASATDPVSGETLKVDVTVNVLK